MGFSKDAAGVHTAGVIGTHLSYREDEDMVFVTVGTHEQPFDRLLREVDRIKGEGWIKDNVIMQTGYSSYEPEHCEWKKLFSCEEMDRAVEEADIVVTHGGPASFIAPLRLGKIPVVVPRQKRYGEHVNDHQMEFCRAVEERMGNIIVVEEIGQLQRCISGYHEIYKKKKRKVSSNNSLFNREIEKLAEDLIYGKSVAK